MFKYEWVTLDRLPKLVYAVSRAIRFGALTDEQINEIPAAERKKMEENVVIRIWHFGEDAGITPESLTPEFNGAKAITLGQFYDLERETIADCITEMNHPGVEELAWAACGRESSKERIAKWAFDYAAWFFRLPIFSDKSWDDYKKSLGKEKPKEEILLKLGEWEKCDE